MKKLNIVSDEGDLKIQEGDIYLLNQKITSDNQGSFATLKDLEKNLILRNWNIWPRVFVYNNCLYFNFQETFNREGNNPQVYSNYSYLSSVKFSTARKLTHASPTSINSSLINQNTPFVPKNISINTDQNISPDIVPPSENQPYAPSGPRLVRAAAPTRAGVSQIASITKLSRNDLAPAISSNTVNINEFTTLNQQVVTSAIVNNREFNLKYSQAILEEAINGTTVTFSGLYSEIMNLVDSENDTGVSMYYHLSSLYDLIKKSGVVEVITPGSPVYTSAVNLSKYVRNNCICHVTVSYSINNLEGQEQIKFSPCQLSPDGELKPLSERFEIMNRDLDTICVIECQDFCVRVFPENTDECIITNCYITYEN